MSIDAIKSSFVRRFNSLRRRYFLLNIGMWFCIILASLLTAWLFVAIYDYFFEASVGFRRITIGLIVLAMTIAAVAALIRQVERAQQRRFASLLESKFAEFGQRLRTTLDVLAGRVRGPEAMLGALANQTLGRWETVPLRKVLPAKQFLISAAVFFALAAGVVVLMNSASQWRTAMMRAAGKNDPYTYLSVYPGNTKVLEGAESSARLELAGRPDRKVVVVYRSGTQEDSVANDNWVEASLLAKRTDGSTNVEPEKLDYEINFGKMSQDIEYQFKTSVGTTPLYRLSVQPLIRVTATSIAVESPAYTRLEERIYSNTDVTVLRNSEVKVTIATNHPLAQVTLKTGLSKSKLEEVIKPQRGDGNTWFFNLPSDDSLHWSFEGASEAGVPMQAVSGRLRVRGDTEPKLYWRSPSDGFEAHSLAELPMSVIASDDYGLEKVGIVFQLGEEEFVLKEWSDSQEDTTGNVPNTKVTVENALPLESFHLTEHEYVSYYAYAIDNCADNPHRIETDVRYIDIRPLRQQYQLAELDANDFAGEGRDSLLQPLSEIIRRQRFVINRTKRFAQTLPNDPSLQLNTVDRLVENQSELASLVRFLSTRLAVQGSDGIEALGQAETLMLQAADSLSAAAFSIAYTQENDALRALAEARNQVINLISNSPQAQQIRRMRELARQLRQKLRMDRPKTEMQIADSLEALAREQSQITDQVRAFKSDAPFDKLADSADGDVDRGEQIGKANATDSAALEDGIKKQQLDLHDRFVELAGGLEKQIGNSVLLAQRIKNATASYDSMERGLDWNEFESHSQELTSLLSETALHVRSLAPTEPVGRISELRMMAASMGGFERQLATRLPRRALKNDELEKLDQPFEIFSTGAIARSETALDVLELPVDVGDVETSEVNDTLAQFVQRTKFKELLETSRLNFQNLLQEGSLLEKDAQTQADEATSRSKEFHDIAQLLDELYQQLMTPKLDQLRHLEEETSELAAMMSGQENAQSQGDSEKEIEAALKKLQDNIKEANLDELLSLLEPSEPIAGDSQSRGIVGSDVLYNISGEGQGNPDAARVHTLLHELRGRIQHMILMEISPERDIPVPQRYKQAVDKYFERVAGASSEAKTERP